MNPATKRVSPANGRGRSAFADLLDAAGVHDHHAVGERHRFDLVVRDVDRGSADLLVHFLDLGAHLHAQLGVQVGQRLVEQEHLRIAHDRAPHGHALALAAGELLGLALQQLADIEDAGGILDARARSPSFATFFRRRPKDMFSYTVMCGYSA